MRMDSIKAKIAGLTPQLYQKSDIDFNFIDKHTSREEGREEFKHINTSYARKDSIITTESEVDDGFKYKKVVPRETFDPPVTPEDSDILHSYTSLRDRLKHAIRAKELDLEALS